MDKQLDLDEINDEIQDGSLTDTEPESEIVEAVETETVTETHADEPEDDLLTSRTQQMMRLAADFENYKRRQDREKEETAKFAGQQILMNLLPVIDNFERALQIDITSEDLAGFVEGIRMIHKQLLDVLKKSGVELIEAVGQPFNPEFHEAIMSEANDELPDETVISEFQKGYVMHGRLLRPAIVKISKAS